MHGEALAVATVLGQFVAGMAERVAVVVSADLSHTHPSTYHLPGYTIGTAGAAAQPFVISKPGAAAEYDTAVAEWAQTLAAEPLLGRAAAFANDAQCDNHVGFVLLHHLIDRHSAGAIKPPTDEWPFRCRSI